MTTYARIARKSAPLHSDFAKDFVKRRFGEAAAELIYSLLPKYSRGPRKGLEKGWIVWDKVERGGWYRKYDRGGVILPGTRNVGITLSLDDEPGMRNQFMDREHWPEAIDGDEWLATVQRGMTEIIEQSKRKRSRW